MTVKKRPVSPRQKMINLMYIVLLAMLALNVSNEVLKGFDIVGDSLNRTTANAAKENEAIYKNFTQQLAANPTKVKPWYDKAMSVKHMADSLYNLAEQLRWDIAREADGKEGTPYALENKEDLDAAGRVMLAPVSQRGLHLLNSINSFRQRILTFVADKRQAAIIASNLNTDVPRKPDNIGKNWPEYMFESMPSIAAITMLNKLQHDVRAAEGEVLHNLIANIDLKDIRVNEINAYVLPEATTLFPGETFKSRIVMAAVDTTKRPEIYINGRRVSSDGNYNFTVGSPGEYTFSGYILMPNAAGDIMRRNFTQKYNVIAPPTGATVAADLMNVLYAGYNNPISVSASGIASDKIHLSMVGGTLTAHGKGKYVARPNKVGENVTFTVTGEVNGRTQTMGAFTFKVRKLPDPAPYIMLGTDRYRGGRMAKASAVALRELHAAIDDGLLDIPFSVRGFEAVFFDRMGNARPEVSAGASFTEAQRELIRSLRRGQRFYISKIRAVGPDGIERTLPQPMEIIVN